eukprot:5348433-Amphidinium_carterae.1
MPSEVYSSREVFWSSGAILQETCFVSDAIPSEVLCSSVSLPKELFSEGALGSHNSSHPEANSIDGHFQESCCDVFETASHILASMVDHVGVGWGYPLLRMSESRHASPLCMARCGIRIRFAQTYHVHLR